MSHACGTCSLLSDQHDEECEEGCFHWPALCCPGCDCGSFEAAHGEAGRG